MRAWVQHRYGGTDQLRLTELPDPVVGEGRVLVRVGAVAVDRGTCHVMTGLPLIARPALGLRGPRAAFRTPGRDFAGVVEAVGAGVEGWAPGDAVHGTADGSLAEVVITPVDRIARPPAVLTTAEAAALPVSGLTAYQALRDAKVAAGQRVLVVGSSGGVGHLAVQVASAMGAHVTAVCRPAGAEQARRLGATHVIDRTGEPLDAEGVAYDVVLDVASNRPHAELRAVLGPRGTLVCVGTEQGRWTGGLHRSVGAALRSPFVRQRLVMHMSRERGSDLAELDALVESAGIRPVIDLTVPFEEAPRAIDHVGNGAARGKVVVEVAPIGR